MSNRRQGRDQPPPAAAWDQIKSRRIAPDRRVVGQTRFQGHNQSHLRPIITQAEDQPHPHPTAHDRRGAARPNPAARGREQIKFGTTGAGDWNQAEFAGMSGIAVGRPGHDWQPGGREQSSRGAAFAELVEGPCIFPDWGVVHYRSGGGKVLCGTRVPRRAYWTLGRPSFSSVMGGRWKRNG